MIIIQIYFLLFFIFKVPFQVSLLFPHFKIGLKNLFDKDISIFWYDRNNNRISKVEHAKLISTVNFTHGNIQANKRKCIWGNADAKTNLIVISIIPSARKCSLQSICTFVSMKHYLEINVTQCIYLCSFSRYIG